MLHLAGKYLVFVLQSERFALPLKQVAEILKPVSLTPVPHAPAIMSGIFNLRGVIVPVYDLRCRVFTQDEPLSSGDGDASRFLVLKNGPQVQAISCDRLEGIVPISSEEIEPLSQQIAGISISFLSGRVSGKEKEKAILLLDLDRVLAMEKGTSIWGTSSFSTVLDEEVRTSDETKQKSISILTFLIGEKVFAFELHAVSELIQLEEVEPVSSLPGYVHAMTVLRETPIPLINLCHLMGLEHSDCPSDDLRGRGNRMALVMEHEGLLYGLLADEVLEIRDVPEAGIQKDPTVLTSFGGEIRGVIEQDGPRRFILLLENEILRSRIDFPLLHQQVRIRTVKPSAAEQKKKVKETKTKYLVFSLLDLVFALPVKSVREIVSVNSLTPIPGPKNLIAGLTNVRGVVHSVIDLKSALGMSSIQEEIGMIKNLVREYLDANVREETNTPLIPVDREPLLSSQLGQLLLHRSRNNLFAARACRLLLADLTGGGRSKETIREDFECTLDEEKQKRDDHPKILILSDVKSRGIMVDSVRKVVDIGEKLLRPVDWVGLGIQALPFIKNGLIDEESGFQALIPDLNELFEKKNKELARG